MNYERLLSWVGGALLVLFLVSLLAGQVLGQPILLGFVETGSMAPTMDAGDGFVAIPSELADDPEPGDVVVFESREIDGGALTTHRIVGETDRGYVTQGDANPASDQDGGEPPVQDAQIVATALQVDGQVVVLPHLGTAVMGVQSGLKSTQRWLAMTLGTRLLLGTEGLAYLLLAGSVLAVIGDVLLFGSSGRKRARERARESGVSVHLFLAVMVLVLVLAATAAMTMPAGTERYDLVSAEFESDRPTVVEQGHTAELSYASSNGGLVPVHVFLESGSDGLEVDPEYAYVDSRDAMNATVTVTAPGETGHYPMYVTEYRYLAIFPASTVETLYQFNPWAPIVVIDAILGVGFYTIGRSLVGSGRVRRRERTGATSGFSVRGLLRRLYE